MGEVESISEVGPMDEVRPMGEVGPNGEVQPMGQTSNLSIEHESRQSQALAMQVRPDVEKAW